MQAVPRLNPEESVHAALAQFPWLLRALQELGVETCCGGGLPLRDALSAAGDDAVEAMGWLEEQLLAGRPGSR